jgi:hypothetical protein
VGPGGLLFLRRSPQKAPGYQRRLHPAGQQEGRPGYFPKILARNIPHPYRLPGLHRVHPRAILVSSLPGSAAPHAGAKRRDWTAAVRSRRLLRPRPATAGSAVDTVHHCLLITCEGGTGLRPPGAAFGLVPSVSRCRVPCESSVDQMPWDVNVQGPTCEMLPAVDNREGTSSQGSRAASLSVHAALPSSPCRGLCERSSRLARDAGTEMRYGGCFPCVHLMLSTSETDHPVLQTLGGD